MSSKICNVCKQDLPLDNFYVVKKRNSSVVWHKCKTCCKNTRPKEYQRNWELQKKYGISLDEYIDNCKLRDNRCDICEQKVKTLHVDHCHSSGNVRGYLCGSCNRALGLFKDSSKILSLAQQYLEEKGQRDNTSSNS